MQRNKIIVILGPTASGKTKLAVKMAVKFNGEIVSADSRQVYRGMDVGTGKDLREFTVILEPKAIESRSKINNNQLIPARSAPLQHNIIKISYYLIDIVSPKKRFDLAQYQKLAFKAIDDILKRGKLPILVGGSGLYLQAVADNYQLSRVKKNAIIRKKLDKINTGQLYEKLKKLNPKLAKKINNSDKSNKRRLIRYIEILEQSGDLMNEKNKKKYESLIIGINAPREKLKEKIKVRLIDRLENQNMIGEVEKLFEQGLSWKKQESFGLEYKFISLYLQKKLTFNEMVEKLNQAIWQFARRQMSWFRRWERQGAKINWVEDERQAEKLIRRFK